MSFAARMMIFEHFYFVSNQGLGKRDVTGWKNAGLERFHARRCLFTEHVSSKELCRRSSNRPPPSPTTARPTNRAAEAVAEVAATGAGCTDTIYWRWWGCV
jgi:hypothetical protein